MNHSSAPEYFSWLIGGENIIIASCYLIIGAAIAYGIWRNRQTGIDPMIVAIAGIFLSCSAGHFLHCIGMLGNIDILRWQAVVDLTTVMIAVCFLSFYRSIDLLTRFSRVAASQVELQYKNECLEEAMAELKNAQIQLINNERMSSLGQLVAGVAHEINNPINFIHGNIVHINEYTYGLLKVVKAYQEHYRHPPQALQAELDDAEISFITEDLVKILQSVKVGTERIRQIVLSLRNFSRLDEAEFKQVDIHEGIDNTLLILQHRLQSQSSTIAVVKQYGTLPSVECYPGQLNQVFMNLLINAIDALEDAARKQTREALPNPGTIWITTQMLGRDRVQIIIANNGTGMNDEAKARILNPSFKAQSVLKGAGLGLSISRQIVADKHHGELLCDSHPGQGTTFIIEIPVCHADQVAHPTELVTA